MCRGGNGTEKRDKKKNSIKKVWLKYLKKASFGVINSRREREREKEIERDGERESDREREKRRQGRSPREKKKLEKG